MKTLSPGLRRQLERAIADARDVAEAGARAALEALAVHHREPYEHMGSEQRTLRRRLRAHGRQLGDRLNARSGTQSIDRLVHECAYEQWHSMLFARFLAENRLLMEPESGVAVTLEECEELGKDEDLDRWGMAARFAHRMLPQVFRPAHPAFEIRFAREHRLKLESLIESLPADTFVAADALGWVYQFWQSRRKDEVNRSGVKIGADELPAVTQLFTEPYMVFFLLDNTLGAWWAARRLTDDDLSVASSEAELRRKAAIPGVPLDYLRFVRIPLHPTAGACAPPSPSGRGDPPDLRGGDTRPEHTRAPPSPSGRGDPPDARGGDTRPEYTRAPPSPSGRGDPPDPRGSDTRPEYTRVPPSPSGRGDPPDPRGGDTRPEYTRVPPSPSGRGAGGEGGIPPIPPDILKHARSLRSKQTDAEQLLWGLVRDRRFAGKKFRRQHPIGRYILDFYCHEFRLAVELDGGQHNDEETRSRDDRRSRFLSEQGVRVVRFWNHDVLLQTDSVLESLWDEVHGDVGFSVPSPQTPLPVGEGLLSKGEGVAPEGQGLAPVGLLADTDDIQRSSDQEGRGATSPNLPGKERSTDTEERFTWAPAGDGFSGWPDDLAGFRLLDPCCGSGHFLVAAFSMLVPMRMELEGLSARDAVDAVLRENLHGLELDPRCVEVAVFALALTAWTHSGAEGYRLLPEMNLACSGLAPNATKEQWSALSEQAAAAGGLAPGRDLFGVDDTLLSAPLRNSMDTLYELFSQAPVLGSLIDPHTVEADLFQRDFGSIRDLFAIVLKQERGSDEEIERAVAARGMARAAQLLADRYTLVITNVPYLARGKQGQALRVFCERNFPRSKNDLATSFLERCLRLCAEGGTASLVLPQNWLFLSTYRKFREKLLKAETWHLLVRLGEGGFVSSAAAGAFVTLLAVSRRHPLTRADNLIPDDSIPATVRGLDVSEFRTIREKITWIRAGEILSVEQAQQLKNPDARVTLELSSSEVLLERYAFAPNGMHGGDSLRFRIMFWEVMAGSAMWRYFQTPEDETIHYGGREHVFFWPDGGRIHYENPNAYVKGRAVWERQGIAVRVMRELPATLYCGDLFDISCVPIVPKNSEHLVPMWCFCSSPEYNEAVRRIDQKLNVTNATLAKVPFDLERWTRVAKEQFPNGLPLPYSNDPTQWLFHGHPCGSVVWDETQKRTVHGPLRTEPTVLQVAVARLLGYRWPAEHNVDIELADEQRECVRRTETLLEWMDEDGIVCIPSVRGEPPARDRLLGLLAAAFGDFWSDSVLAKLLANVDSKSLDDWLRDRFFDQHCKLFHHRPFVWHIWDGRRRDGFHALVNYHTLAAGDGKGRQLLESLTFSYLGDWIARQRDGAQRHEEGAEDRLAAACVLQGRLEAILEGEPPYDIFVRWTPIHEQPIGWEPDINDGVRLNIRPFMADDVPGGKKGAGVLRSKPKISWKKDRGKEGLRPARRSKPSWVQVEDEFTDLNEDRELRPREDYPWFWTCPGDGPRAERTNFSGGSRFDGNRWNDLHYTNAMKSVARERRRERATNRKTIRELTDGVHLAATSAQSTGGRSGQ